MLELLFASLWLLDINNTHGPSFLYLNLLWVKFEIRWFFFFHYLPIHSKLLPLLIVIIRRSWRSSFIYNRNVNFGMTLIRNSSIYPKPASNVFILSPLVFFSFLFLNEECHRHWTWISKKKTPLTIPAPGGKPWVGLGYLLTKGLLNTG